MKNMTTIYITNYYFEELKLLIQNYFNLNYSQKDELECSIFMKNSRTYFLQFNQTIAIKGIIDWMNYLRKNSADKNREVIIEVYTLIENIQHNFFYSNHEIYSINEENILFKVVEIDNFEEIETNGMTYKTNEIPTQKLHLLEVIKHKIDKKTWWKFWKN